jgi:hypothetical protein
MNSPWWVAVMRTWTTALCALGTSSTSSASGAASPEELLDALPSWASILVLRQVIRAITENPSRSPALTP